MSAASFTQGQGTDQATPKEIAELQHHGFKVEDLGAEYGLRFEGQFRWINIQTGAFQVDESSNESDAWSRAKAWSVDHVGVIQ